METKKKKTMSHDGDSNFNWCTHQRIDKEIGGLRNKRTGGNYPNNSIIKIGQNTKKIPEDLWSFAVAQTPVRNYQTTRGRKTLKQVEMNEKHLKRVSQKNKKTTRNQIIYQEFHQKYEHLDCSPCKRRETIL